jgi:heterodisulfide reductase subunit A
VARAVLLEPKESISVEVVPAALVIGGGIAGLSAALHLANRGFEVKLVERQAQMGGLLRDVHTLYPTGAPARPFIDERMSAVQSHPRIEVLTEAQVSVVRGFVGNYEVTVARGEREYGFCVGTIIVATGARELHPQGLYSHDGNRIVTQGELERRLAEGLDPRTAPMRSVVMIQCAGARGEERPYCSRICCMTAVKNATLIRKANPAIDVRVLYRDMLTLGAEYESLYREAREEGVVFIQYDPQAPPTIGEGQVTVYDARLGETLTIPSELTVLSVPLVGRDGAAELAQMLKVPIDEHGFFLEAHVKLRPLDFATDGIYLCGSAHWPSDVGESVAQAYGAAARASILLRRGQVEVEPITSVVDEGQCIGCGLCEIVCPYNAITLHDSGTGRKAQTVAASCKGCGVCGAGCPAKAISMLHFRDEQIFAQIDAALVSY